jgi:predicted DsbA family dithiol-disulfide isomerase
MIGLSETHEGYDGRGYRPENSARSRTSFARRFGMPFRFEARPRNMGTGLACRAVKAAELQDDDLAEALLRALRFGYFATNLMMDTEEGIAAQAATVEGLDVDRLLRDLRSDPVEEAYQADRAESRNADETGRPMILQDKHTDSDGANRYTAPSLVFARNGDRLVAGGWQSFAVYDAMIANLAPELERRETPEPGDLLPEFPHGLTTQEVAVACTANLRETEREETLRKLVLLAFEGKARRVDVGDDALWLPA